MSIDMKLGAYLMNADGARHQLALLKNPSDVDIRKVIQEVATAGQGVVVLTFEPIAETGPEKLEMYVDAGNFLLMLCENEEDGDYTVRTLTNSVSPTEFVDIMAEKYPARSVTRDIDLACAVFYQFALTGDVPQMG